MKNIRAFLFLVFLGIQLDAMADKLEKGFERLNNFDYFNAKQYFEKSLDDEPAAAAYGLSAIYASNKNPFYNPDSARRYILIADSTYSLAKEKTKKYYSEFNVNDSAIQSLSSYICTDAFKKYTRSDSVELYNHYLKYFSGCAQVTDVATLRNSAAFERAKRMKSSAAFKEFMVLYPQSKEYQDAFSKFDEAVFNENTTDRNVEAYERFLNEFPENSFRKEAEENIYRLSVPDKTPEQYAAFARKYKNSSFRDLAWKEVYARAMTDFNEETYEDFKTNYPDFPFPDQLEADYRLNNLFFLPFADDGKWGYMNEDGEVMIKPAYSEANLFSEGLAVAGTGGKLGYINKSGKVVIEMIYADAESFHNGTAVVMKDSMYGVINKGGQFIIPPSYDELSEAGENIFMAVKNDLSGYINTDNKPITPFEFDVAGEFKNGNAIVSKDEKYGLINSSGQSIIAPMYEDVFFISADRLKAMNEEERWGIIDTKGNTIAPFIYDAIGEYSEERVLVSKDGKCGFLNRAGETIIPLSYKYSEAMNLSARFNDGYVFLRQPVKSVVIDSSGVAFKIPGVEDYGSPAEGLIPVRKNRRWGFATLAGEIIIQPRFDFAENFQNGFAKITVKKLSGLIDSTGSVFIQPLYEDIEITPEAILVKNNGEWGLLSRKGILLVPCIYKKIDFLSPLVARATGEGEYSYINLETGKVIFSGSTR